MVKDLREKDQTTEVLWSVIRNDLRANGTFDRYAVVWVSVVVAANEVYLVSSSVSKSDRIGDKVNRCIGIFSVDIYDKREFHLMVGSGSSENNQTSSSKSLLASTCSFLKDIFLLIHIWFKIVLFNI